MIPKVGYKALYSHNIITFDELHSVNINEYNDYEIDGIFAWGQSPNNHTHDNRLVPHVSGLHYCNLPQHVDVFIPPNITPESILYAVVQILGNVVEGDFICVTDKLFVRELLTRDQLVTRFAKGQTSYTSPSGICILYTNGICGINNINTPSIVYPNGRKEWWVNGEKHRESHLPAVISSNGKYEYWKRGVEYEVPLRVKCVIL